MSNRTFRNRDDGAGRIPAEGVREVLSDWELLVVSNRQPYAHNYEDGEIIVDRPLGGLASGLDPLLQEAAGTWVAWGDGEADRSVVDEHDRVMVPPADPAYSLRRVWLSGGEVDGYYYGFSNRVLWPLCHACLGNVHAERRYWDDYRSVNERFADVVVEETAESEAPFVWFQDYHLALAPRMARSGTPQHAVLGHFWHVPWPSWDVFDACPHGEALIEGLLGNDIVGFHVERYRENFLECVDRVIEGAAVKHADGVVHHDGRTTTTMACPLGIDVDGAVEKREASAAAEVWDQFAARFGIDPGVSLGLGVERLDYTKGVPQRLRSLEAFWEAHPEWRERFTYVQKGTESRSRIPEYQALQQEVQSAVDRINQRFGTADWTPVVYTTEVMSPEELYGLYRRADLAIVTPFRDGLNLVASEYVAAQDGDPGVLLLSDQAGVHERLGRHALSVSPFEVGAFVDAVATGLEMPTEERRSRMRSLQLLVASDSLSKWVHEFAQAATERGPQRASRESY